MRASNAKEKTEKATKINNEGVCILTATITIIPIKIKVTIKRCKAEGNGKVNLSLLQAVKANGVWGFRLPHLLYSRLIDGGKFVSLTPRPPFYPPGKFLVLISVRGWND
jgi:hypothetical protein